MAVDFRNTDLRVNAALDALYGSVVNSGKLRIYDGSYPSGEPTTSGHGTLLAELTFGATAFGSAAAVSGQSYNQIQANAITADSSADAAGTAVHFLVTNAAGTTAYFSGTVGTSSADMIIDNTTIAAGANVSVNESGQAFRVRLPKGWTTA